MLHFSMSQSGIDFKCPYSNRPLKPLIGLWQGLFSGTYRIAKSPSLFNWYMSSAIDLCGGKQRRGGGRRKAAAAVPAWVRTVAAAAAAAVEECWRSWDIDEGSCISGQEATALRALRGAELAYEPLRRLHASSSGWNARGRTLQTASRPESNHALGATSGFA
jgi:hypothetical protein